jgi:hypothetical protein
MGIPNRKFKREYSRLYRKDPLAANVFILLAEVANERGEVRFETPFPEVEIQRLMVARFADPQAYQRGGPKK